MRLQPKVFSIFAAVLALMLGLAIAAFPSLVSTVSEAQLYSTARTLGAYLVHDLESLEYRGDASAFEKAIDARFEFVQRLGQSSGDYVVRMVVLVGPDFKVENGHPDTEIGADYSGHEDIREAMSGGGAGAVMRTVLESAVPGGPVTDADIVAPLRLADGDRGVLEVKLDFSKTLELLALQYRRLQAVALALIAAGLAAMTAVLTALLRRAVLKPILRVSEAMERVGRGDLGVRVEAASSDEIGSMAERFDEMVRGLKERFELERYVSRGTASAARDRVDRGLAESKVERKRLTVLFSDVRGFTSYSERTDPARVVEVLNRILGVQDEIIAKAGGDVDKFVGDEVLAVFKRPALAVAAALAIRSRVVGMGADIDGLALGFGIHEGELVEGDIGSAQRMDHTVIGDTVNTGARLQAAAKANQILVSESVVGDPEVAARFDFKPLGEIAMKGKELPFPVFAIVASKQAAARASGAGRGPAN